MSMNLSVYVGPYLVVEGVEGELLEDHECVVACAQGENRDFDDDSIRYLKPNINIGIKRKMEFSRYDYLDSPFRLENEKEVECEIFRDATIRVRDAIDNAGGKWWIAWGIVCGVF